MPTPLAWLVHSVWVMAHWLFNVHGVYCCRLVCFDACDHMTLVDVPPRGVQLVQAAMPFPCSLQLNHLLMLAWLGGHRPGLGAVATQGPGSQVARGR